MIRELIIMKLALAVILQHCNSLYYGQEVREQARLLKLKSDYEASGRVFTYNYLPSKT